MQRKFLFATQFVSAAVCVWFAAMPITALADQKPRDLAMESYRFMAAMEAEGKLDNWIKNANKVDYFTQFSNPAKTLAGKWPVPLKEDYYDYADCYFALDLLIRYADKAALDKSWDAPELVARKARFSNTLHECQRDLRKTF